MYCNIKQQFTNKNQKEIGGYPKCSSNSGTRKECRVEDGFKTTWR